MKKNLKPMKGWTITVIEFEHDQSTDGRAILHCLATKGKQTLSFSPLVPARWLKDERVHYLCRVEVGVAPNGERHIIRHAI